MCLPSRCLALSAVILLALGGLGRLLTLRGVVVPVRVAGGSMAETLCGAHFVLRCDDCGFPCRYDADFPPTGGRGVICPNCGFANRQIERAVRWRGDRVLIDRLAYAMGGPQRWDVVAFHSPGRADALAVKRIVGLPGDRISIRGGDVYANDTILRKSLAQLRSMAILVHDSAYRPRSRGGLPRRWQPASVTSGWRFRGGTATFEPSAAGAKGLDWLVYHHWRCVPGPYARSAEYPVLDNYGYNQQMSRQLKQVTDLMLACRMRSTWDGGAVAFSICDGRDRFCMELIPEHNQGRLYRNDELLEAVELPPAGYGREVKIELALCDRQVLFAINSLALIERAYRPTPGSTPASSQPIAIGAAGMSVVIGRAQVLRDVYYLAPNRTRWDWTAPRSLKPDEYFVLGDNAPRSEDSRHWPEPALRRKLLIGKVLRFR